MRHFQYDMEEKTAVNGKGKKEKKRKEKIRAVNRNEEKKNDVWREIKEKKKKRKPEEKK